MFPELEQAILFAVVYLYCGCLFTTWAHEARGKFAQRCCDWPTEFLFYLWPLVVIGITFCAPLDRFKKHRNRS